MGGGRGDNGADAMTGMLIVDGERCLQVVEGPHVAVERTFGRIRRDSRHRAEVVLARKTIEQREFGEWSMAYRDGSHRDGAEIVNDICSKTAAANPNLRAELVAFARQMQG